MEELGLVVCVELHRQEGLYLTRFPEKHGILLGTRGMSLPQWDSTTNKLPNIFFLFLCFSEADMHLVTGPAFLPTALLVSQTSFANCISH